MAALRGICGGALPLISACPCLMRAASAKGMPWEHGEFRCHEGLPGHLKYRIFIEFLIFWEWRQQERPPF